MGTNTGKILTFAVVVLAISPTVAQDKFELPISTLGVHSSSDPKVSLGSVGLDSRAGASYLSGRENNHYYFNIPSERPFQKVPGVWLRIPFGSPSSH